MNRSTKHVGYFEQFRSTPGAQALVVFVHGLGGDYGRTWGSLPDFICADPRFCSHDVYLFGYRSRLLRPFDPDLDALGQRLRTVLLAELPEYPSITLVAHSMGGLIVREAIASVLIGGQAQRLRNLHHIIFCSTPHLGSVSALFAVLPGRHLWELRALRPKILDNLKVWLSRVNAGQNQLNDIAHECYTCAIRITNVWGLYDHVVSRANAFALPALDMVTVEGTHTSMVKPPTPAHNIYGTLSSLVLATSDPRANGAMACERVFRASQTLGLSELAITSTVELPSKYEALCGRFLIPFKKGVNDGK